MLIVLEVLLNILLFIFYIIVSVIFGNFLYGFVLNFSGNVVPGIGNPIHMKIALVVFLIVSIFTIIFRKYFYLKISFKKVVEIEKNEAENIVKEYIPGSIIESISLRKELQNKTKIEEIKEKKPKTPKIIKENNISEEEVKNDDTIEIFMGKEIK